VVKLCQKPRRRIPIHLSHTHTRFVFLLCPRRKSTIINLLLRFYDPKGGKIFLDGREYESLRVHQLRRNFGVVTQETELFPLTIEENIAYGLNKEDYTMEDVVHAAKQACAHEFICEMKDGYQTRIGERGLRISGE
jgi:ABC-type multidrug transport system fused ATPase/permease subunit